MTAFGFDFVGLVDAVPTFEATAVSPGPTPRMYERISYLVPDLPTLEHLSPNARTFASVRDGAILLRDAQRETIQVLCESPGLDWGWEIDGQGVDPWAPNGQFLFASLFDRTGVFRRPRVRFGGPDWSVDHPHQPLAGALLGHAQPYIVALEGSSPLPLQVGTTRDCYFRLFGWAPDSAHVWIGRYARDMSRVDVLQIDSLSGMTRCVLTETSTTYLCDVSAVIWGGSTGFTLLADGRFLWRSERDGWSRIYSYDATGDLLASITPSTVIAHDIVRIDADAGFVYLMASQDGSRPYDVHLYRASLEGGSFERLTDGAGRHEVRFDALGARFIDIWSSAVTPPRAERRHSDGRLEAVLGRADISRLIASGWHPPEELSLISADQRTSLNGLLFYPTGFEAARRYPLIEMVYGGPQMAVTPGRFLPSPHNLEPLLQSLAHAGFHVLVIDARGTPGRSKAFRDAAFRDFGDHVVADHVAALRQLTATRSHVDADRIGVFGRSWGGYFALRFLLDAPEIYKAGISIVPGFDVHAGMLYEPYLGNPHVDDSAYRAADLFSKVHGLRRPLMIMSGTLDTSTLGDAYRMSMTLTAAGVVHTNIVFPDQDHVFTGPAVQLHDRLIYDFFERELRG